ncbi:MAG: rRNA pseudouridine synthase [Coriobacteriia bacterium]|nr:rRNA pseudouridine synthase [Coriobacteriia bacterium]
MVTTPQTPSEREGAERIAKFLARAGIASRRASEEIVAAGRVSVNGEVVTSPGTKIVAGTDEVRLDGAVVEPPAELVYLMLNKPMGVMTTLDDPQGRPTVADYIPPGMPRVFPVGRLDYTTTGLLLLTNDGELAQLMMHPRHHVPKLYYAVVDGIPDAGDLTQLRKGVLLDDGLTSPAGARVVQVRERTAAVELTLREGRKRQVRRMLSAIGHPVIALSRIEYGPLTLGDLPEGAVRLLEPHEVEALRASASGGV